MRAKDFILKPDQLYEACWKGYHKEGNKKMFGKTYPNCVKNTNEGVAKGSEKITEYRDRMYQYLKSIVPGFPDYVVKDWLYANFARGATQGPGWSFDTIGKDIPNILKDMGLSVNTKWQLVPNMKFTMDMWEPKTLKRLQARAGGNSKTTDPDVHIPARDAERHSTQAVLAKQQGGVRKEPVILIKTPQGYELLEGWHRTIQHFAMHPQGYTGPAYVAVAQGQQGMAEGFSNDMSTEDMIAYLRQHHDKNLHPDYLNHLTSTNSKFVLKNIPINSLITELPGLDKAKVEQYKKMDFSKAPPIVVGSDGNILDGYHRANVAKALGISTIKAYVGVKGMQGVVEGTASGDSSLHDWFTKSKASDGTKGWVQLGGKYAGKPCARQPGQKTKPKCGSSKMKRNLSAKEEEAAARRKRREDPNPDRRGKAKNVATKSKRKTNENQNDTLARDNQHEVIEYIRKKGYGKLVDLKRDIKEILKLIREEQKDWHNDDDLPESLREAWSKKYKRSIDCSHPKGFSQRAHCQSRKKK